jgi:hypothetical protein
MCKEDIRVARKAYEIKHVTYFHDGTNALLLPANPNRYALVASGDFLSGTYPNLQAFVGVRISSGEFVPVISLSPESPHVNLTVVDIGQLITSELWAIVRNALIEVTFRVAEVSFLEKLEDV